MILCTFTEKAAFEMRDRIAAAARRVGFENDLSELHVTTIHGLCNQFIATPPPSYTARKQLRNPRRTDTDALSFSNTSTRLLGQSKTTVSCIAGKPSGPPSRVRVIISTRSRKNWWTQVNWPASDDLFFQSMARSLSGLRDCTLPEQPSGFCPPAANCLQPADRPDSS